MSTSKNIVLAVTGASGSVYAARFIERAMELPGISLHLIFSDTAKEVWAHETGLPLPEGLMDNHSFNSPFCSGSAAADCMVVLPCSMGTMARIAAGLADCAIARIADVQLKEKKKLILVPREAPLNLIHIGNMQTLAQAGAVIFPASPSFYSKPASIGGMVDAFVSRILQTAGVHDLEDEYKWNIKS